MKYLLLFMLAAELFFIYGQEKAELIELTQSITQERFMEIQKAFIMDDNPHREIFLNGWNRTKKVAERFLVKEIGKGCEGCHKIIMDSNQDKINCLLCHHFKPNSYDHKRHINSLEKRFIPKRGYLKEKRSCLYCHNFKNTEDLNYKRGCYSCHQDGHYPIKFREFDDIKKPKRK